MCMRILLSLSFGTMLGGAMISFFTSSNRRFSDILLFFTGVFVGFVKVSMVQDLEINLSLKVSRYLVILFVIFLSSTYLILNLILILIILFIININVLIILYQRLFIFMTILIWSRAFISSFNGLSSSLLAIIIYIRCVLVSRCRNNK